MDEEVKALLNDKKMTILKRYLIGAGILLSYRITVHLIKSIIKIKCLTSLESIQSHAE